MRVKVEPLLSTRYCPVMWVLCSVNDVAFD